MVAGRTLRTPEKEQNSQASIVWYGIHPERLVKSIDLLDGLRPGQLVL